MVDDRVVGQVSRREASGSLWLWFGLLAAPAAWITQLVVTYSLEEWFACSPAARREGEILGAGVETFAVLVTTSLAAVALAGGLVAAACLHRVPSSGRELTRTALQHSPDGRELTRTAPQHSIDDPTARRARWMALAGVMNSVLYLIAILVSYGPPLILDICETSP